MILKGFKYRIYPNKEQIVLLEKYFGCVRSIYNLGLETKKSAYQSAKINLHYTDLSEQLTDLKKEFTYFKEVNSQSLQASLKNLETAFQNMFKYNAGFPKFKSKKNRQSFHCPQNVEIEGNNLFLPKFKTPIKIKLHRKPEGKINNATIEKTPTGKYFVSVLCEINKEIPQKAEIKEKTAIALDLGLKDYATLSSEQKIENPKYLNKMLKKLQHEQRVLSRRKKGSGRREKQRKIVAKIHEKVTNQRRDFLNKLSDSITKNYDTICLENLMVENMVKNHKLAKAISDASWGMFRTMLEYKAEWRGKNVLIADTFFPSSKLCSVCGYKNDALELKDRTWYCPQCKTWHDRDINASTNIKHFCLEKIFGEKYWSVVYARQDVEALDYEANETLKERCDNRATPAHVEATF